MDADLDTPLDRGLCTADDLLPARPGNARRSVTDAELVTLAVAQAVMGIPSDRRFLAAARRQLRPPLSRCSPASPRYHKRRGASPRRSSGWPASSPPGARAARDDLVLLDSTPVECGRSSRPRAVRSSPTGRLRLQPQPLALFLGHAPAPGLRPGRHATGGRAGRGRQARARGGARVLLRTPARRRDGGRPTRAMPAGTSRRRWPSWARSLVRPAARRRARRTGRSWGPIRQRVESVFWTSRTCSHSSATAPAPARACARASACGCSRSPPASGSTTSSAVHPGLWSTTSPELMESVI